MPSRDIEVEVVLARPCWESSERLLRMGAAWLAELAETACAGAHSRRGQDRPDSAAPREFRVIVGDMGQVGSGLIVPTVWQATATRATFPTLDADLRIAAVDHRTTLLHLDGRYTPPASLLGDRLAEFMLHRLVETSIDTFLAWLADTLAGPDDLDASTCWR